MYTILTREETPGFGGGVDHRDDWQEWGEADFVAQTLEAWSVLHGWINPGAKVATQKARFARGVWGLAPSLRAAAPPPRRS